MVTDDASVPTPHLILVDHPTLRPCPQCGARRMAPGSDVFSVHALWASEGAQAPGSCWGCHPRQDDHRRPVPRDSSLLVQSVLTGSAQRSSAGRRAIPPPR